MLESNFFSTGSPYLNHPLLTAERTAKEIDFVVEQAGLSAGQRILDVGCGAGRHSIELAQRGYEVVGIDPSAAMIAAAKVHAAAAGVAPEFIQARGEAFSAEGRFEAAISLFTTLGQIDERGENSALVKRTASVLQPGGSFIIEVPNHYWVAENLKPFDRFGDDDNYTEIIRQYDPVENIVAERFALFSPGGKKEYLLRYRLFSQKELGILLRDAALDIKAILGDYDGRPFTYYSPIIVIAAQKR